MPTNSHSLARLPAYVLAGGRSSRFGSDKARALLDGEPLLQRITRLVQPFSSRLTVVADKVDKYTDLNLRTIADLHPGLGPLAGLECALKDLHPDEPWLLLCNCDAAILRPAWINQLLAARSDAVQVVAYYQGNRWQPLPGLYAQSLTDCVRAQLDSNDRSLQQLLNRSEVTRLPLPVDWPEQWQVNTPADIEHHAAASGADNRRPPGAPPTEPGA